MRKLKNKKNVLLAPLALDSPCPPHSWSFSSAGGSGISCCCCVCHCPFRHREERGHSGPCCCCNTVYSYTKNMKWKKKIKTYFLKNLRLHPHSSVVVMMLMLSFIMVVPSFGIIHFHGWGHCWFVAIVERRAFSYAHGQFICPSCSPAIEFKKK